MTTCEKCASERENERAATVAFLRRWAGQIREVRAASAAHAEELAREAALLDRAADDVETGMHL